MQKTVLQRAGKQAILAGTAVLYVAALVMFSYVFTQN
jgi:hypothetical protein